MARQLPLRRQGHRGKNTCCVHMKELFNTKSVLFTECQNSIPSSRYSCLSTAEYSGNWTFPIQTYVIKIQQKIVQITIFWSQKWFQTSLLMFFRVSLWFESCKTTKNLVLSPFWEILSKKGLIFAENVFRDFKSRYLIFHVFEQKSRTK